MDEKSKATDNHGEGRDTVFQVSLLQSLAYGDYEGSVTIGELKSHGDVGIGTFNRLNGEMIMLDGEVYRARGDGGVEIVRDEETSPFSVVTFMDRDEVMSLKDISDYEALCRKLNQIVEEKGINRFYTVRIDGLFREANVRSVYAQDEPYRRLVDVMADDQTFFDYENVEGTLVGLYCPSYMSGLNAVGWHMHFISRDKTKGGHVLDISITDAILTIDSADAFEMRLPQNKRLDSFDLSADQSKDIEMIESNKRH